MRQIVTVGSVVALAACFAAPARAQFDPQTLVGLGHADPSSIPFAYFDVRLDERGLPRDSVGLALRSARPAGALRARALEIERLKREIPLLSVYDHEYFGTPQWIGSTLRFLTPPSKLAPRDVTLEFVAQHPALTEIRPAELVDAPLTRNFVTRRNGATHLTFQQQIDGLTLVGCVLKSNVTKDGELINLSSSFLPVPDRGFEVPQVRIPALEGLRAAAANVGMTLSVDPEPISIPAGASQLTQWSAGDDFRNDIALTTDLVVFPITRTELVPAWHVIVPKPGNDTYEVFVSALDGSLLERSNQTKYAMVPPTTQDVTYRVYTSDSPAPGSPGTATPTGAQFPLVPRQLVTVSAASIAPFSPDGWIPDGANETLGNNVDAHTDTNADNSPDLPRPAGAPFRVFDFAQDNALAPSAWRPAAVTQLFYLSNLYHDKLFDLGFDEAAGNFQTVNFSAQGSGGDAVQADCQDGSGTNNANFGTGGGDGSSARCQMYVFTGTTPDRDGDLDADIIYHELTHGVSIRLHSGTVSGTQSGGMGEGWGDFMGCCLNSEPADDPNAVYCTGGYTTNQLVAGYTTNYYFGIRRFPYCTDLNKNPQTYADIDTAQQAYPPAVPRSTVIGNTANEVHNVGEVWCMTLWEARANLIAIYGFPGNDLIMRLVIGGMTLSVNNPNFLNARDAILQSDLLDNGGANLGALWQAFAKRGMGFSATSPAGGSSSSGIVEAFDVPAQILFAYPQGKPALAVPGAGPSFLVDVTGFGGPIPTPGTGVLNVSINGGAFNPFPMTELTPNHYVATLPAGVCLDRMRWYVSVGSSVGTRTDPATAPALTQATDVVTTSLVSASDDFETNLGWTGGVAGDTATTGVWVRVDPVGTGGGTIQPEDDHTGAPGVNCWVTGQGSPGGASGSADVDGGRTTLLSPVFNLSAQPGAQVSYWRWFANSNGGDVLRIDVSNDNGTTWVNAETVGPAADNNGGWIFHQFTLSDFVPPTATVRVRVVAEDAGTGNVVEAAFDDFAISTPACDVGGSPFCFGDSSLATGCPCGNTGAAGHGCANSVVPAGAVLGASGTPNPDTMVLTASGMPSAATTIFLQGDVMNSAGIVFGDGARCIDGSLVRIFTKTASGGAAQFPEPGDALLSVRGGVTPGSGVARGYQAYYRNAAAFCAPATFNVSSGWVLVW